MDAAPQPDPEAVEGWPPGHFYSPIPSLREVRRREDKIFGAVPSGIPGIDLREAAQLSLFEALKGYYVDQPFGDHKTAGCRFFFENPNFSYGEAIILYCLMRHVRPKRVIEIGSGYSSCAILDTNERCFNHAIDCTFIEPYPDLLMSLLKAEDLQRITLLPKATQDVDLAQFTQLAPGDMRGAPR